ncbi:putative Zn(II)2Cys6 transcription factor [Aspergillus indologenus CBS 114.80]|uniref:Putative Zn(II)2Cys6 transcription factor n=1 Tax=Aspergillus indologenus CBS 114.80 TaxID=1450541 RepID=A0A2V5IQ97_9EURO|nr:putative Zn(II)2Cys6 transcription factor [Aspergillus indologenus CBS 114.80]
MDSPRRARNRAACRRCQRRKIRCDGITPTCGACQKSGVACVNDGKQEVHRSYIANMENRIKWLESIVREKCSNVDLSNGPERHSETLDESIMEDSMQQGHASPQESQQAPNESTQATLPTPDQSMSQATAVVAETSAAALPTPDQSISHHAPMQDEPHQAHEIGLVSLSRGSDPRYIGPSSGYFFAKRIFSNTGWRGRQESTASGNLSHLPVELLNPPAPLPPQKEVAVELSTTYFRTVHLLYPFLHEQRHMELLNDVYSAPEENPTSTVQVYMVLAIASLNLSRQCKLQLPVEGYYASAMKYVDYVCHDGSMAALQCLLLLMVYALYNPSCNVNIWNLNYQCLASVIDLGLQRDVRASPSYQISLFTQEMRTRVFWVAYTFDRTVCTMMGRPIGLRDEACEIRFPLDIPDSNLMNRTANQPMSLEAPSHMSYSIHLFKLAQLNSEIKYVMHSICRDAPAYAYPPVKDIFAWQRDMMRSLQEWQSAVPQPPRDQDTGTTAYCHAKYHETMVLLLRPSPAIPAPAPEMLDLCVQHAFMLLQCFGDLYDAGRLLYSRLAVHAVFLGTLVLLHGIWKLPETATRFRMDELIRRLNTAQSILSSIGEHWAEAASARDCIAQLSNVTVQRLLKSQAGPGETASSPPPTAAPSPPSEFSNLFDDLLRCDFQGWSGVSDLDGLIREIFSSSQHES